MKQFNDRVAVVTGAAHGIGQAMVERFAAERMNVVLADIDPELDAYADELASRTGVGTLAVHTDVSDANQVRALATQAVERFGTVHVVCNNAGTGGPAAFWNLSQKDWEFELGVNLWGVINGVRAFLPILREQNEGHIVNTASLAAFLGGPFIAVYNVAKAGIVALSETLYTELAQEGSRVGVSVLCPGPVKTSICSEPNVPESIKRLTRNSGNPAIDEMRRLMALGTEAGMSPEEVASRVLDAISEQKLWIITHPEFEPAMRERFEQIVAGENPPVRPFSIPTSTET